MAKSMQEINYNVKMSIFKPYILDYLKKSKFGESLEIDLSHINLYKGYEGKYIIEIGLDNEKFKCSYKGKDKTRFSARIRAGASALRDNNLFGNYEISHFKKKLNIKKLD